MKDINAFVRRVKHNCDISDAKFWGYYSICGLLMRYRELFRSEHSLMPWDSIANDEVSTWIHEREMLWQDIGDTELQRIDLEGKSYDPFDVNGLNAALQDDGMVYGAGYGTFNKPTFFVAKIETSADFLDYRVFHTGSELCRDLAATPAMLQGRCIYVRPEVLAVILWDRFLEMKSNRFSALAEEMFAYYSITRDSEPSSGLYKAIRDMANGASEVFVRHEAGEAYEDEYSDEWFEILSSGCDKATELYLRGIKDVRADSSLLGPLKAIVDKQNRQRLSFFLVFLDGIRRQVFPEIMDAFRRFVESGDWSVIEDARKAGYRRSERLQSEVVGLWKMSKDVTALAAHIRDVFRKPGPAQ